jgi:ribosomal RNA assembly protein
METVRIPQERIAVLIGVKGEAKKRVERKAGVSIKIDEDGFVEISSKDSYKEFIARDIVKAIARGFTPEEALRIADGEHYLKVIDLKDVLNSDKAILRQKARLIGENGRTRTMVEECSGAKMVVYGSTVSLIGLLDEVELASDAISKLLEGKPHSFVYRLLEMGRRRMKEARIAGMWEPPMPRPPA